MEGEIFNYLIMFVLHLRRCLISTVCLASALMLSARETYVGVSGFWADNNTDSGPGAGLRVGWHLPAPEEAKYQISTDVEVEASYWQMDNEVDYTVGKGKADTKSLPVLANLRVNVPLADTGLFIYGGGGLGISWIGVKGTSPTGGRLDDSAGVFTYAFFVGLGGQVSERVAVRAGYRAVWMDSETFNDSSIGRAAMDSEQTDLFELSLRVGF